MAKKKVQEPDNVINMLPVVPSQQKDNVKRFPGAIKEKVDKSNPVIYRTQDGLAMRPSDLYKLVYETLDIIHCTRAIIKHTSQGGQKVRVYEISETLSAALYHAQRNMQRIIPAQGAWGIFSDFVEKTPAGLETTL